MKLYLITQEINNDYDTYDSFVVVAEDEESAKTVHPLDTDKSFGSWVKDVKDIQVEYLGEAKEGIKKGEILGSFNAG